MVSPFAPWRSIRVSFVALAFSGLCGAALAAGPVVVDSHVPAKGARAPQFTVVGATRKLDARQMGRALDGVAKDSRRGPSTPVAVLLDPALTLKDVGTVVRFVGQSGMKHVRYFVYQGADRNMVMEMSPGAGQAFPRSRLDSEVMAAPK